MHSVSWLIASVLNASLGPETQCQASLSVIFPTDPVSTEIQRPTRWQGASGSNPRQRPNTPIFCHFTQF